MRLAIFFFIAFLLAVVNLNNASVLENDATASNFVVNNQVSWLTSFCMVLSVVFEPIYMVFLILILSVVLWVKKYRQESIYFVFVAGCAGALIFLLKHLFTRTRPLVQFLTETGYSFPSGHALISVVLFGSLIYFALKFKPVGVKVSLILVSSLGIIILGLSRVYLNVHWFSDITGGYFLGATVLFTGIYLYKANIFRKLVNLFYPK